MSVLYNLYDDIIENAQLDVYNATKFLFVILFNIFILFKKNK